MNFNLLQYQLKSSPESQIWRFSQGKGKYQNLWVISGEKSESEELSNSISFLLGQDDGPQFERCAIEISSKSGDQWRLEKTHSSQTISKNGQVIQGKNALGKMNIALLDLEDLEVDAGAYQNSGSLGLIKSFGIGGQGQNLWAAPWTNEWQKTNDINDYITDKKLQAITKCKNDFACDLSTIPYTLTQFTNEIEPIYWAHQETQSLLAKCQKQDQYVDTNVNCDYVMLQKQIQIISEVDKLHAMLAAPGTTISDRKSAIENINQEISDILNHLGLKEIPSPGKMPNWTGPIETLTKIQVLERLITLTNKAKESVNDQIEPILEQFYTVLTDTVSEQSQHVEELESCLSSINLKLASDAIEKPLANEMLAIAEIETESADKISAQKDKIDRVLGWFEKFSQKASEVTNEDEQGQSADSLETLRMSLDFTLAKFNEIKLLANDAHNNTISVFDDLDPVQERQFKSYKALRKKWKATCTELGIPENTGIKQLVQIVVFHIKLFELVERLSILQEAIEDRKISLTKLESLIFEWRRLNNSQKKTSLENSSILLNEARSILQYKDDRKKKLASHDESIQNKKISEQLLAQLQERAKTLSTLWATTFQKHNLTEVSITSSKSQSLINLAKSISNLETFSAGDSGTDINSVFLQQAEDGINFWKWDTKNHENQSRLTLLRAIEVVEFSSPNIFLTQDSILGDFFQKMGAGSISSVETKHLAARSEARVKEEKAQGISSLQAEAKQFDSSIDSAINSAANASPQQSGTLRQTPTLGRSQQQESKTKNRVIKSPSKQQQTEQPAMSAKAQAVLDIFNKRPSR